MEKVIRSLEELDAEAARFMSSLSPSSQGATLVTLSGELGAGKTAFTKAVAKALGVDETVTSPTFVLEKIYKLGSRASKFERLVHIDAYRLEKGSDLAPLGFDELMKDSGNLVMLEWPEKVEEALPTPAIKISLAILPDGSHTISYG
ncbi:tRNA (adenosine(37)-N6)-threonylcarbamoyltransferase complex ATPase subunit type 1 TsaE [Candidatus Kaiserbacteria bacterium GWA2_50_9]|uniref:tRNA threonylcarbamoyladenosine biosynthesis protein TsaE n=1 Tax=Candidatus Kaiserbacteria bacterium GWA2_50_9 TaxID=1798474 RepID=A0A1F6BVA3_9BACT|nr:MAG: tRNA (adenosine(37)-N6)-threonylcarbamoyltransferase complex ATPase subunit type 1 TsaE [Candidatus Kaiserbacteria bacterium GWA2_50_9]